MRTVPFLIASLAVFGAAASAHAEAQSSEPNEPLIGDLTCEDIKAMLADVDEASSQPPPQPPPECEAVCLATRLATCAVTPRACSGYAMVMLDGAEVSCDCMPPTEGGR